ncbi:WLM domain protein [Pseudovibrio sp. W64]|uniref:M48 family metallopeptidase n=1 Tax=Pseudovibrio sp. W64 TaxID=1735583 RepID=UPI0007AEA7C0|nr:SprT family zinc-dependent metalloprotease [Pseudovibrio sp. W64]KZK87612.1 WLM domain protein [Pseudovibrio sp. W64]
MTSDAFQYVLVYGTERIPYVVQPTKGKKRKLTIHVEPDGRVIVEAPAEASQESIEAAVSRRGRWIFEHVKDSQRRHEHVLERKYVSGETAFYLGRRYKLKVLEVPRADRCVKLLGGCIEVRSESVDPQVIRGRLRGWYKVRAQTYLGKRLEVLGERLPWVNQRPQFYFMETEKRWGGCSSDGTVQLNPFLVKAPRDCIDYVLLHELCHHKEHNHSPAFYALLDRYDPNWKATKLKLDDLAELLLNE